MESDVRIGVVHSVKQRVMVVKLLEAIRINVERKDKQQRRGGIKETTPG